MFRIFFLIIFMFISALTSTQCQARGYYSDGNYSLINKHWKRDVQHLVLHQTCNTQDKTLQKIARGSSRLFWIAKAVMITESLCDPQSGPAIGAFQVKERTCRELGVKGNLREFMPNATCGVKYIASLITGGLTEPDALISYNRGPGGMRRMKEHQKKEARYLRKIDFVLETLVLHEGRGEMI